MRLELPGWSIVLHGPLGQDYHRACQGTRRSERGRSSTGRATSSVFGPISVYRHLPSTGPQADRYLDSQVAGSNPAVPFPTGRSALVICVLRCRAYGSLELPQRRNSESHHLPVVKKLTTE
jgi:hypothetical protein